MEQYAGIDVSLESASIWKLAVVLHRMLVDGTEFVAGKAAAKA
jgi:hypothetical protein